MYSIIHAAKAHFRNQHSMLTSNEAAAGAKPEPLTLAIYAGLPPMPEGCTGPTGDALFKLIEEAYPEESPQGFKYPSVAHNRKALYKSIHFLRTKSMRRWMYDVEVTKGDYTKDVLLRSNSKVVNIH